MCGQKCKSGCGADLATYSHCNLKLTDANHNGMWGNEIGNCYQKGARTNEVLNGDHKDGFSNGVVNGCLNGITNGVQNGRSVEKNGNCPYK